RAPDRADRLGRRGRPPPRHGRRLRPPPDQAGRPGGAGRPAAPRSPGAKDMTAHATPEPAGAAPAGVTSSEQEAAASVRSLRRLMLLCLLVPLLLLAIFGYYRYQQVHEEAEVRLDRA